MNFLIFFDNQQAPRGGRVVGGGAGGGGAGGGGAGGGLGPEGGGGGGVMTARIKVNGPVNRELTPAQWAYAKKYYPNFTMRYGRANSKGGRIRALNNTADGDLEDILNEGRVDPESNE